MAEIPDLASESADASNRISPLNENTVTVEQFTEWLRGYQSAWEGRDAAAAARLFSDDARYHWTPLVPPQQGPAEIAAVWDAAVSQQRDIRFTFDVFAVSGATGMATLARGFHAPARPVQGPHRGRAGGGICSARRSAASSASGGTAPSRRARQNPRSGRLGRCSQLSARYRAAPSIACSV